MQNLITLRTFSGSLEFEMVRSYLNSFEIECFAKDENINRAYLANVDGGIKLQVMEKDVERALALLIEAGYLTEKDLEPNKTIQFIDKIVSRFRRK